MALKTLLEGGEWCHIHGQLGNVLHPHARQFVFITKPLATHPSLGSCETGLEGSFQLPMHSFDKTVCLWVISSGVAGRNSKKSV